MSDADRVALRFIEEAEFGESPSHNLTGLTVTTTQAEKKYAATGIDVLEVGQTILVAGMANAASNGYKTVASVGSGYITVKEVIGAGEAGKADVSVKTALNDLRFTSESLAQDSSFIQSKEIRSDRQVPDTVRTAIRAGGDIGFELSYGALDEMLAALLMAADWSAVVSVSGVTYSMAAGDNSINDSGSGFVTAGFAAGQWIRTSGFTEAANNGLFKIVSVAAGKMVLAGGTVVTESAGDSVTVKMGAQIVNGITGRSFTFEREHEDLATTLEILAGMMVEGAKLNIASDAIITGSLTMMGKSEASATASIGGGTPQAAAANDVMSATDDVLSILENMAEIDSTSLSLDIKNNLRERKNIGELGPSSMGKGKVVVTGSLQMYFETKALMDKYRGDTDTSLVVQLDDADGNAYVIDLPRVRLTAGKQVAGGENTDVVADMSFQAIRHPTEDVTIRIARFAA